MHGIDDGPRVLEGTPFAGTAKLAADPAGVNEPAVHAMLRHALGEHGGVPAWVENDEGRGVAGRKGRDGLEHAVFCPRGFRGVTGQKVIGRLLGGKLAHGGQDAIRIAGEHDDILRLGIHQARNAGIGDKFNRVGAPGVLGDGGIVVVGLPGLWVVDDVFENGAETDGIEYFGLLLTGKVDTFGIAAAFDVKYARF